MKRKHIVTLLLIAAATASFFGCKDGLTMFEQIDQETKLEDAVITGAVKSVVKFKSKLYASDGNLYSKDENVIRDWSKIDGPGGTIIKLAADSTNLYALSLERALYKSTDGITWQPETCKPTSGQGIETIFCNGKDIAYLQDSNGKIEKIVTGSSATSDDVPSTVIVVSTSDKTYYADGETVKGKNGSDLGSVDVGAEIYSLTYSDAEKAIYAGTKEGLKKLPVNDSDGKLTGTVLSPPGNWGATIKDYEAHAVLAAGTALYSSTIATGSTNAKVNGLWGYYYSRRDNWNRE